MDYERMLAGALRDPRRYAERHRPQFHFSPPEGWMNDPNGLVCHDGECHLFHQHAHELLPPGKNWGHAVSTDLVHWRHLPVALRADELGEIFSGSAVVDWHDTSGFFAGGSGLVAAFTHHGDVEQQSIACSRDRGRTWTKYGGNPVIPNVGERDFRDPKVFWHDPTQRWVMIVAGGTVRIYSSPNLRDWTLESVNEDIQTECPDLFPLAVDGDPDEIKWVLNRAGRSYVVGGFDGHAFVPDPGWVERGEPLNYGPDVYAAQTFADIPPEDGRRIMVNWMADWSYAGDLPTAPWQGAMTFPCALEMKTGPDGVRLRQTPVRELEVLRHEGRHWRDVEASPGTDLLADLRGRALEIVAEFALGTASEFGFRLRKGGGQQTALGYNADRKELFLDRTNSGGPDLGAFARTFVAPLEPVDGRIKLHVFLDWSSVEVFANEGARVITACIFPEPDNDGVELYAQGGAVRVASLEVYRLSSIWRDDA